MTSSIQDDPTLLVHAYLDGELDPANAIEMERRFAADPALAAERERVEALRGLIRERVLRERSPAGLARRIEAGAGLRHQSAGLSLRTLAASVVLAAVVASGSTWFALRPGPASSAMDMVVASHMRALMAPQPTDVSSSDRHTVKPWFNGRIPQAPRVVDLTDQGFPMVGGRIDVIGRVPVPTLVYRHRQHLISLTAIPAAGGTRGAAQQSVAGYNMLNWIEDETVYWVVSDLGSGDLETFAKAFRNASPER